MRINLLKTIFFFGGILDERVPYIYSYFTAARSYRNSGAVEMNERKKQTKY